MRMMMTVSVPTETGNKAIVEGTLPKVIGEFIERARPESAYFTTEAGRRTAYFVLDVKSSTDMPSLGEPFFMTLNAAVDFRPVMNVDELRSGLSRLAGA